MAEMKNIMNEWRDNVLNESGLARFHKHMTEHDTAIVTAFRNDPTDMSRCSDELAPEEGGENTTLQTNKRRNRELKAMLLDAGFGVTAVDGSYIENYRTPEQIAQDKRDGKEAPESIEVKEGSFFVVNLSDSANFFENVVSLGVRYCQDSVLLIPKGGQDAYVFGTNNSEWPGMGNRESIGGFSAGKEGEFMTRVSNRPIVFKEEVSSYQDLSRQERMVVRSIASKAKKIEQ